MPGLFIAPSLAPLLRFELHCGLCGQPRQGPQADHERWTIALVGAMRFVQCISCGRVVDPVTADYKRRYLEMLRQRAEDREWVNDHQKVRRVKPRIFAGVG